jgi:hypothetical protein
VAADEDQLVARQGEHNAEVLKELGFGAAEIAALETSGALVQPSSNSTASDGLLPIRSGTAASLPRPRRSAIRPDGGGVLGRH